MRFFGSRRDWVAPATKGKPFEPPPVGQACEGCGGAIAVTDTGILVPVAGAHRYAAFTRACWLRYYGVPLNLAGLLLAEPGPSTPRWPANEA